MKKPHYFYLLLCLLVISYQAAHADGIEHVVFNETFDTNEGTGGRDGNYSGSIAANNIKYDNDDWTDNKVKGAKECLKFGTSDSGNAGKGFCTTPTLELIDAGKTATLTFSAAGWGDSNTNTLTITAEGATLTGDTNITLSNGAWNSYTVTITEASGDFTLTFTGKRGFLDDIRIVETVTTLSAPTLTAACSFFANTTETATKHVTITPAAGTTVHYTTDGTEPSSENGILITMAKSLSLTETTTIKAIAFYSSLTSNVVTRTYTKGTTVSNISAFRALPENTEARLYLSDANNARVLFTNGNTAYLRDNTGAICLDFASTATFNPTPAFEQHVAGWIVGQYQVVNGLPTLVATANTNTNYLALAGKRNETDVTAKAIEVDALNSNLADWVSIDELTIATITAENKFALTCPMPYDGALVDIAGIAIGNNKIAPTNQLGVTPVVFVLDEAKAFTSPNVDIENATVRLKRTLSSSNWNTFAVPFDITTMSGQIREFDHIDGTTMKFTDATGIEAGKPYLVKPTADIVNPVYEDVTLSATSAQTITNGDFNFVATYSPVHLATDKTEQFLKTDGKLYYPTNNGNQMKGMRAFFRVPVGVSANIAFDDETTDIQPIATQSQQTTVYDLQGRKVNQPSKGLYIVNGKKLVIH